MTIEGAHRRLEILPVTEARNHGQAPDYGGPLVRLKRRAEFQAVRGGRRWSGPAFLIEGKAVARTAPEADDDRQARFGFTITKKLGNAVARNRIRRRLGHALREARLKVTPAALDYVVVARAPALEHPYTELVAEFCRALEDLKQPPSRSRPPKSHHGSGKPRSSPT